MKNTKSKRRLEMLSEYDFSKGVRGKYAKRYATGSKTLRTLVRLANRTRKKSA